MTGTATVAARASTSARAATRARELLALARLELSEIVRSRWLVFAGAVYAVLSAVLIFAGMRESSVLGFSGMGRVMLSFSHVLLFVLPLLALAATAQVVSRARHDGTIELLFSQPLSRTGYLLAVSLVRYLALALPLALLLLAMGALARFAFAEEVPWAMVGRTLAVSSVLLWTFTGVGMCVSVHARHEARAVTWSLFLWLASVALLDLALIGLLLQWRIEPRITFAIAALNPVQAARLALLSGVESDLGSLGPVGFFLSHRLGADLLLALGLVWPFAVGSAAWLAAYRSFTQRDLV